MKPTLIQKNKIESLAKWRNSELDRAQVAHVEKRAIAAEREQAVDAVQTSIDSSQDLIREHTAENRIISTDALTRLRLFAAVRLDELKQAQSSLDDSLRAVADARTAIVGKFEELAVIERLRTRRRLEADKDQLRDEQKRLDDQAVLRLAGQWGHQLSKRQEEE